MAVSPAAASPAAAPPEDSALVAGPPVALYVHVPFCVSLCPYCDFVVYAGAAARGPRARIEPFVDALRIEIGLRADAADARFGTARPSLETVYLGGGTPSLLPSETISGLLDVIRDRFGLAAGSEVTVEANPGPDERGDLSALHEGGVSRVSFGAQSFDDAELRRLGRRHRARDVADAVAEARAAEIGSISLDLLYDVPGSSVDRWAATLEAALALEPDHLSLYALTLDDPDAEGLTGLTGDHLPTTAGARRWRERARFGQDEDRAAAAYQLAIDRLGADGWKGYEISNWARPGHECRHNLAYWQRLPYEAVGPGAHAFDGRTRRWNAARLDGYVAALVPLDGAGPRLPPGGEETLDPGQAAAEAVILGLRMDRGIPGEVAALPAFGNAIRWALDAGLAVTGPDGRVRLTTLGRLLSNELFARLV